MFRSKKPNAKKALKFEKKGDKLSGHGKYGQALKNYEKSKEWDPSRPEIYQKLIDTLNQMEFEWAEEDFNRIMDWTLRQQELQHPELREVYEKFSTEYRAVKNLVQQLMTTVSEDMETQLVHQIVGYGEKASLPVLDFLLSMKKMTQQISEAAPVPDDSPAEPTEES